MYHTVGRTTITAGTEITAVCPAVSGMVPVLRRISYDCSTTEHNLYAMGCRGLTTAISSTDAGGTTIELAKIDPGMTTAGEYENLATGDWVVYQTRYGDLEVREISSVSGATITVAATTRQVDVGAKVWSFYNDGDGLDIQVPLEASTISNLEPMVVGHVNRQLGKEHVVSGAGMPMLVVIDNATAAGVLNFASFTWIAADQEQLG